MKFLTAVSCIFYMPSVFFWCNPFGLSIAGDIDTFRPKAALIKAYSVGLLRDILLLSPHFGLLGLSSAIACIATNTIVRYFSIEGLMGIPIVLCFACLEALADAALGSAYGFSAIDISLQQIFVYTVSSCLYAQVYLSLASIRKKFFRERAAS